MARPSSPHTVYPNSSNDHSFMPRREFIRDDRVPSTFAILTLSSSSFIRLFGFPQPFISALRRLLLEKGRLAAGFREDIAQNFCEFTIEGKPWGNPKSVASEKLLVDILAVLFQQGYAFLTTLDYGREQDDRVAMAFSKPTPNHAPHSPHTPFSALHRTSGPSPTPTLPPVRVPFALSFPNATTLRVISPPLHSTPAILQAVRGAWPRGVESEKKVGDSTFEFKLKGYKCRNIISSHSLASYIIPHSRVPGGYICNRLSTTRVDYPCLTGLVRFHSSDINLGRQPLAFEGFMDIHWYRSRRSTRVPTC